MMIMHSKNDEDTCTVCGGNGKSLTYDCCGRKMTGEELRKVENLDLDYKAGKWRTYASIPLIPIKDVSKSHTRDGI